MTVPIADPSRKLDNDRVENKLDEALSTAYVKFVIA